MQKLFEFDQHIGDWRVLVQSRDINNGAIRSRHIADDAVTAEKIGDNEVKSRHIANGGVTAEKIGDNEVKSRNIAEGAIQSQHIVDDAVTAEKIGDNEVKSRNIANGVVTAEKIGDNEVKSRNIAEGAIQSQHIVDDSITGDVIGPDSIIHGKIADDAIHTRNIKDRNVTAEKIAKQCITLDHLSPQALAKLKEDFQNQIDALEIAGVAVSNVFGSDAHISVSQKALTAAFNRIWEKLEDITGEILQGINMVVTPTFFVSEDGCDVHLAANTVETNGIFEKIQFFVDGNVIYEAENVEYVSFDHHLDIKPTYEYVIMCKAKIIGIEYTRQQIITRYNEFYIGAGSTYNGVMDSAHAKQLNGTMRHNYDVTFNESDKLIIVMGASLRDGFIRADLNGAEIALAEETVTIDGKDYVVFTSDAWSEGEYNIDING